MSGDRWGRPVELPASSARIEVLGAEGMLDEVHRAWSALRELRARHASALERAEVAEDAAWLSVIDALGPRRSEFAELFASQRIEFVDVTGARCAELNPQDFRVLESVDAELTWEDATILETWQPAIVRNGRTIRPGGVVVGAARTKGGPSR